jgi:hypothetical protein
LCPVNLADTVGTLSLTAHPNAMNAAALFNPLNKLAVAMTAALCLLLP